MYTFTIQNVPIKYLEAIKMKKIEKYLQYKMFLLNDIMKIDYDLDIKFTIQNVPIKYYYNLRIFFYY